MECDRVGCKGVGASPYIVEREVVLYCQDCVDGDDPPKPPKFTPIIFPEGYILVDEDIIERAKIDGGQVRDLLERYEDKLNIHFHTSDLANKTESVFKHLEHQIIDTHRNYNEIKDNVIEHLLGVRVLVNMIVNGGNWTHAQKNNTIHALGELTETGIKRLRQERWEFGQYHDPFAPMWSITGQYHARVEAEKERDELRQKLAELESPTSGQNDI